jgi:hypothetical protein
MPTNFKLLTPKEAVAPVDHWAFRAFCISTFFIIFFSVEAIHTWPTTLKRLIILLACTVPAALVFLRLGPKWLNEKSFPKEIIWVLMLLILGTTSSIFSTDSWTAFKSVLLFMVAGPINFIAAKYLLQPKRNQELFLWMNSLILLSLCSFGIFEHNFNQSDYDAITLFSGNPLPAGTALILLSASPMILLNQKYSPAQKFILSLGLVITVELIILSAKKSHILGLTTIILCLIVFINRNYFKYLLGFLLLSGVILYFSGPTFSKYKSLTSINSSVALRAENYYFGLHVFKQNPIWGVGFKSDLSKHLDNYSIRFSENVSRKEYQEFINIQKTFENIFLAFLVEWGALFSLVYFGGLSYIFISFYRNLCHSQQCPTVKFIFSTFIGFAVISLTFDTLRLPNLNWMFHSLLALMVNSSNQHS